MSIDLNSIAGTRDFFPDDFHVRDFIIRNWKKVSSQFGFQEYDSPILENVELYTRKGGDDILKEMFVLEDGNNRYALRPEITPSVVRMAMKYIKNHPLPLRWFSVPQCWRNEDTSRGRKREFYQWNVDIFGATNWKYDVEVLMVCIKSLMNLGLTSENVVIKISNRKILQRLFEQYGVVGDDVIKGFGILDKYHKLEREEIKTMLMKELALSEENSLKVMDIMTITSYNELSNVIQQSDDIVKEMDQIFNTLDASGMKDWVKFDVTVLRGLSYYTGMVFEGFFQSKDVELRRAIVGGGRYDDLMESYGYHEKVPCVGFGMGDVVLKECLVELNKLPDAIRPPFMCVIPFENLYNEALTIANNLRKEGASVIVYNGTKISKGYDYANKLGIQYCVLVAPEEYKNGQVKIKNMQFKEVVEVPEEWKNNAEEYLECVRECITYFKEKTVKIGRIYDSLVYRM